MVFINSMNCVLSSECTVIDITKNDRYLIHIITMPDYQTKTVGSTMIPHLSENQSHVLNITHNNRGKSIDIPGIIYVNHIVGIDANEYNHNTNRPTHIVRTLPNVKLGIAIMDYSKMFIVTWAHSNEFIREIYVTYTNGCLLDKLKYILSVIWNAVDIDNSNYIKSDNSNLEARADPNITINHNQLEDDIDIEKIDEEPINDDKIVAQNNNMPNNDSATIVQNNDAPVAQNNNMPIVKSDNSNLDAKTNQNVTINNNQLVGNINIEEIDEEPINDDAIVAQSNDTLKNSSTIVAQNNYIPNNTKSVVNDDFLPVQVGISPNITNTSNAQLINETSIQNPNTIINKDFAAIKDNQTEVPMQVNDMPKQNAKDLDYIRSTMKINAY